MDDASIYIKGVPSAVGFPHCAGSGEGLSLSPKPYPHKCAETGARTRDLPVTDGRLYRCTRPALLVVNAITLILCDSQGQQNLILHMCHLHVMRQQRCSMQNMECM